jgi:hypothetical protein
VFEAESSVKEGGFGVVFGEEEEESIFFVVA